MNRVEPDRVAIVVSHIIPVLGLERCVVRLLDELGDRAHLVCIGEDSAALASRGLSGEVLGRPLRGMRRVASAFRLRRWIRGSGHDVVLVAGAWAALPLLLVAPRGRRIIVWEHSFSAEKIESSRTLAILAHLARILYRRADQIVCVSEDLARQMVDRIPSASPVVIANYLGDRPAAPIAAASPMFPAGARRLLTVGTLSRTKNQRLALAALAALDQDVVLAVAGDGPDRTELERLAQELGVADRLMFLGHVADPAPWFRWCEAVIHPARGETFGLAMFEAAAHHRPVVCLDYGVAREVIGSAVPGVRSQANPAAFAAAIRDVLAAPPGPEEFADADSERLRRYSSEEITRSWLDVLRPGIPAIGGTR